jgi:putative oxidoreductase
MSDIRTFTDMPAGPRATPRRALHVTLWAVQVGLALLFAMAGVLKLSGAPEMVAMFNAIGAGQWFRYVVGALEVAGAIGLLVPRLSGAAALGLTVLMVGATATQVFILGYGQAIPATFVVVTALVAWARWPRTRALASYLAR